MDKLKEICSRYNDGLITMEEAQRHIAMFFYQDVTTDEMNHFVSLAVAGKLDQAEPGPAALVNNA